MRLLLGSAALLIGCGSPAPPQAPTPTSEASHASAGSLAHLYDDAGRPLAAPGAGPTTAEAKRFEPRSLGGGEDRARPEPRRRGARRDIRLRAARLDNAITVLARLAGYGIVIGEELAQPVTLELNDVTPYDALMALAKAHDVDVEARGNVLIVGSRGGAARGAER